MSVETDVGFWKWFAGTIVSLVAGLFGYHKYMEAKLDKKADKHTINGHLQELKNENARSLTHIEKLYENAEKDRALTRDLHDRAMERIQENQTQLIDILAGRRK